MDDVPEPLCGMVGWVVRAPILFPVEHRSVGWVQNSPNEISSATTGSTFVNTQLASHKCLGGGAHCNDITLLLQDATQLVALLTEPQCQLESPAEYGGDSDMIMIAGCELDFVAGGD